MHETEFIDIFVDGGSRGNPGPAACAFVAKALHACSSKYIGVRTNNEAEYCALLLALAWAKSKGFKNVRIFSDSQLVVKQMTGEFEVREPRMQLQYDAAKAAIMAFSNFQIGLVKRKRNRETDALCNEELDRHTSILSTVVEGV